MLIIRRQKGEKRTIKIVRKFLQKQKEKVTGVSEIFYASVRDLSLLQSLWCLQTDSIQQRFALWSCPRGNALSILLHGLVTVLSELNGEDGTLPPGAGDR